MANDHYQNNKSLATEENIVSSPSLESNMLSKTTIKCLYGNMYIDIDGNIKVCKYYDNINNIYNPLSANTLEKIWKQSTNYRLENQNCITCKIKSYCNTCAFLTKKEKMLDCKYKSSKVLY
ncbi:hypothetical protein TICRE_18390 [Tissierella creatinophila DSM 6911]|uniref:Uncharacterized protein n=1 Tax=Tissierella creatinophila DSM 6911 TaxID=1123403 RepID=A0A1U7M4Q4_TISCR|nr:hypothetical protein TICRE_18390 [Tissierella creatinophila DSM 6911]